MALNSYLTLVGESQGGLTGSVTRAGLVGTIEVHALDHQINADLDDNRRPSGTRRAQPLVLLIGIDQTWTQLWTAFVNSERFTTWRLNLYAPDPRGGLEMNYYRIELMGARLVGMKLELPDNKVPELTAILERHRLAFVYDSIVRTWIDGGVTSMENWQPEAP